MKDTIDKFVESLKQRLQSNEHNYHEHYSMHGCTETGFYSTDEFDFDALLKEIDDFSAEFKAKKHEG